MLVAALAVVANEELIANDAVVALEDDTAQLPVPNNEPVIPLVTFNVPLTIDDPVTVSEPVTSNPVGKLMNPLKYDAVCADVAQLAVPINVPENDPVLI
jgi:hypothetical protein